MFCQVVKSLPRISVQYHIAYRKHYRKHYNYYVWSEYSGAVVWASYREATTTIIKSEAETFGCEKLIVEI